jgi:hypothetical protein
MPDLFREALINPERNAGVLAMLGEGPILSLIRIPLGEVFHIPDAISDLVENGHIDEEYTCRNPPARYDTRTIRIGVEESSMRLLALNAADWMRGDRFRDIVGPDDELVMGGEPVNGIRRKGLVGVQKHQVGCLELAGALHSVKAILRQNAGLYVQDASGEGGVPGNLSRGKRSHQINEVNPELGCPSAETGNGYNNAER